jgi:hypothetical protein
VPKKGHTNNPNGRPKGTPNKVTKTIREHFATAFDLLQEDDQHNLTAWAKTNPTEFYRLASKLIPTKVEADIQQPVQTIIQIIPDPNSAPIAD